MVRKKSAGRALNQENLTRARNDWVAARKVLLMPGGIAKAVHRKDIKIARLAARLAVNIPDIAMTDPSGFIALTKAAMFARLSGEV